MKKTLLFDLDGTLIDTYAVILASMRYTINEFAGKEIGDTQLMSLVGTPLRDQMARFVSEERADELCAVYREHNDRIHDAAVSAFDGIPAALAALREAGCRMGIVTSKRHHMAVRGLEVCGIDRFFDVVVGSDDWPEHKPQPGPVLHGAVLMGAKPEACFYIGDSPFTGSYRRDGEGDYHCSADEVRAMLRDRDDPAPLSGLAPEPTASSGSTDKSD